MNEAQTEMPKYKCHKEVHAYKIAIFETNKHDSNLTVMVPEDERYAAVNVSTELVEKMNPIAGWYYVVYEDGYKSFSPPEAFESGYSLIE